ncbi:DUF1481 domain-containing protein [Vibrio sp. CAIM 722]|uniref:DUF1481 domain-containing protein n=1 Tax=Vibrio eleionomae TaxID=2653505 RepID=A0A7X4RVG0_9VIBR|nr:DUF1481 domain-containing protein [Vibrio eleionomae]MZI94240.1 DUF1481 domain-containing protein [Vibrio eleionomae]
MKYRIASILLLSVLAGCSSTSPTLKKPQTELYSGGERVGDEARYYWFTEKNKAPVSASDYVISGAYNWYKTSYRWDNNLVREVSRVGAQRKDGKVVSFETLLRFDVRGEPIYQRYRIDGKVYPLTTEQIDKYIQQARYVSKVTQEQDKQGLELIQGVWNGEKFVTCRARQYARVQFNDSLPDFVINRLASIDSYIAFLGKIRNNTIYIEKLLTLDDSEHQCVTRPELLDEKN